MPPTTALLTVLTILNLSFLAYQIWSWQQSQKIPHGKCIMYRGTNFDHCTSWSVTNLENADQKYIDKFLKECTQSCRLVDRPCELERVVSGALQYSCKTAEEVRMAKGRRERMRGHGSEL